MKKLPILLLAAIPSFVAAFSSVAEAQPGGQPYYSQQYPPMAFHNGLTFEGNLGLGAMWSRVDYTRGGVTVNDTNNDNTYASIGANLGLGGFISPNLAITGRIASVNYTEDVQGFGPNATLTTSAIFIGPSIQYWINPNLWIGGGIGYAIAHVSYNDDNGNTGDSENDPTGLALDLRIGYTFYKSMRNSLNVSAEYTPGFYGEETDAAGGVTSYQLNGFAILFGYQYL